MYAYSSLLFTNATMARATVDSVRIHVRCVSHTTPMFKVNHSRWWVIDNMMDLRWPYRYQKPHKIL